MAKFTQPDGAGAGGEVGGSGTVLPDLFTGTMSYSIPIEIIPGRKGMQPDLALTYRSNSGNGWVGVGWDLEVGAIERSTKNGVDLVSGTDYVLRMAGSVIALAPDDTAGFYRAKIEGTFYKIEHLTTSDGYPYWKVTDKTGKWRRFGYTTDTRQADAEDPGKIFKWCLDREEDANGNFITYWYEKDANQIYLDHIDYTGNSITGAATSNTVKFHRESRDDAPVKFGTNFSVRTAQRLSTIEVTANGALVRAYKLSYDTGSNNLCSHYSASTCRSLLTSVQQFGKDAVLNSLGVITNEASATKLPAITFAYQVGGTRFQPYSNWGSGHQTTDMLGDFNGDGKTDVIQFYNGTAYEWLSSGSAPFDYYGAQGSSHLSTDKPADFNGDGKADIIQLYNDTAVVWQSAGVGFYPYSNWGSGHQPSDMLGDFNGDGKMDVIQFYNGTAYEWLSTGSAPFDYYGAQSASHLSSDRLGDFNGDGKTDIIQLNPLNTQKAYVWLSMGAGFSDYTEWGSGFNGTEKFGDFNGDGKTDVIQFEFTNGTAYVWLSMGNGFVPYQNWRTGPQNSDAVVADMNGDGMADLVYFYNNGLACVRISTGLGFQPCYLWGSGFNGTEQFGDFDGDGKNDAVQFAAGNAYVWQNDGPFPDLLTSINNGIGGRISVTYAPSTTYTNLQLPFPVQTVSSITTCDNYNSNTSTCEGNTATTSYTYAGGFFHIGERDFRGFNYVKVTGPAGLSPHHEQKITETWFHQGNDTDVVPENATDESLNNLANVTDGYLKGKSYRTRVSGVADGQNKIYQTGTTSYTLAVSSPYYYTPPQEVDTYICEAGATVCDNSSYGKLVRNVSTFDGYGNVTQMEFYGGDSDSSTDRTTTYSYAYNTAAWIVGLPASETIYQGIGTSSPKAKTDYYYDGAPDCNTTSSNQAPTRGNLTRIERWPLDGNANPETRMAYDTYGNLSCIREPNGHISTVTSYDATNTFPKVATNPLGQQTSTLYYGIDVSGEGLYGQISSVTDPNSQTTTMTYDPLGRKKNITTPDGGSTTWSYLGFGAVGSQYVQTTAGGLSTWSYFDGLGRTFIQEESGPDDKTIVVETHYNPTGTVQMTSLPFYEGESPRYTTYVYDPLGRTTRVDNPDFTTVQACYGDGVTVGLDANSHRRREKRDALGRLVKVEEYTGTYATCATDSGTPYATTNYTYDILGDLLTVTDNAGNQTIMTYDGLGRKKTMHDPDMGDWSYAYYPNGSLYTQTTGNQTIVFYYDALNRISLKDYHGTGTSVTYAYDETWSTNAKGRLTTMTDLSGSTNYYYDPQGRPQIIAKHVNTLVYTTQYTYDSLGRIKTLSYPNPYNNDPLTLRYEYNSGGSLYQVKNNLNSSVYATYTGYNALGQPGNVAFLNGVNTAYGYRLDNNRLSSILTTKTSQPSLLDLSYGYDNVGNITGITDNTPRTAQAPHFDDVAVYDYTSSRPHAVTHNLTSGVTYTYDANGNMTADGTRLFGYNFDNMPITITMGGSSTHFVYDGGGSRVQKIGSATTTYIGKLYECTSGTCVQYLYAGDTRIAHKISGTNNIVYYHPDHLGSTSAVSDSTGAKIEDVQYLPFGETRTDTGTVSMSHKYTHQEFDAETSLYNYNARLYNPSLGRFISADTIVPDPANPQSLNRYAYVLNNPINFTDPSGHDEDDEYDADLEFYPYDSGDDGDGDYGGYGGGNGYGYMPDTRDRPTGGNPYAGENKPPVGSGVSTGSTGGGVSPGGGGSSYSFGNYLDNVALRNWLLGNFQPISSLLYQINAGLNSVVPGAQYFGNAWNAASQGSWGVAALYGISAGLDVGLFFGTMGESAAAKAIADEAFHYTFSRTVASIEKRGLFEGSYATTNGTLSPLQAQIDLALSPNRGLRDAVLRVDLAGLRQAGYQIPEITRVGRSFGMPGGGYEMLFPYRIPPQFITVIKP